MNPPLADAFHEFRAFSAGHAIVLLSIALLTAIACVIGVRLRGTDRLARAERVTGIVMLLAWSAALIDGFRPENYKIGEAFPLQMCDLTALIAPLVLLTHARWLRTLLYFWGIGLSINAILTPTLEYGPAYLGFWLFWLTHSAIIGTAVYDLIVGRYRPTWRDLAFAFVTCAIWLGIVLAVDLSLDVNYGYVGKASPERPTVVDTLGPWPLRVYKMSVGVTGLFIVMWLPWAIARRLSKRTDMDRIPFGG